MIIQYFESVTNK